MQTTEARLAQNHAEFQALLDSMEAATDTGDFNAAISYARAAATLAWKRSCGIFASPRLESLLARVGHALPPGPPRSPQPGGRRRVLTVMSQGYDTGGHTRLACQWMALDKNSTHTLVLSQQNTIPVPDMVNDLAKQGCIGLMVLDDDSDTKRIAALRRLLSEADAVVLQIHPNDPLPVAALAGMDSPPPVLFDDHANHVFWIGASVTNLLVSLHADGMRIATERRGIPRSHMAALRPAIEYPAIDPVRAGDVRARHGIPSDATLLVSCGAPYKYIPIEGQSLASLLAPVLAERPDVHLLLIGPRHDPPGTRLAADFPDRVHLAGFISDVDELFAAYAACDVYLDSFPFSSGSALHEAISLGKAALKYAPQAWSDSGYTINSASLPELLYLARDIDEFRSRLHELIDSPSLRESHGRMMASIANTYHEKADYQGQVDALYMRAARTSLIEIDAEIATQRVELLDILLDQLSDNRMAAFRAEGSGAKPAPLEALSVEEQYRRWLDRQVLPPARVVAATTRMADKTCSFHVLVLNAAGDDALLVRTLDSLQTQSWPAAAITVLGDADGSLPDGVSAEPMADDWIAAVNRIAEGGTATWILALQAGDTLSRDALLLLADLTHAQPELACCYADEDSLQDDGPATPIFKPDLNLDLLRSYPYTGSLLAMRAASLQAAGGLQQQAGALAGYDFVFRCVERFGLASVGHLAEVIHHAATPFAQWLGSPAVTEQSGPAVSRHLDRLDIPHRLLPGILLGSQRVVYQHQRQPPVSIIIPTRDQLPMLNGLIDSLLAKTSYRNYELLIVDNDSRDPAACAYLDGIERLNNPQLRVLRWPHPFNYSAINNFAAAQARGEYLILLNNDTAVLHADWIEGLLNHAQRPEVGIVGAKLHFPDGRIQHGGVLLGMNGPAEHPYVGEAMEAPGYMHRLQVDQNYTAVTAACLMIRKSVYEEVGGLDERDFKISYNDVDLCLKTQQAGYLTVWTPYVRLMHESNASQKVSDKTALATNLVRFRGEQAAMYRKWLSLLARDPAYNRNLGLAPPGFDLEPVRAMAWQPLAQPALPRLFCIAADETGCGHYRVMQPYLSMQREGLAEGMIAPAHMPPVPLERFEPSSLILQRQYTDSQLETMRGYREFSRAFKVYELDDYMPNVPLKSVHRAHMPKDIMKSLRKAVALTDRFVVSTEPLAEAFAGLHSDIRVVPNRLPVDWWDGMRGERRKGAKPRVGWGGGSSHLGDLELIADVVRELAGEVEWVFFGMCPEKLRPHVHEFHKGVPIAEYPAKLASLDLDLALAPLEDNLFNACKSNLRLLEYGACGFPVVCSDIVCYRGDLPVTRVRNRFKEWTDAIRMHLADLDASARMGDALREAVHRDWMLTGDNLVAWRDAWLPD
jgi:GT2 family glycosyltransferase/glycosyltransferase involved in cell wall biosynthesis